MGAVTGDSRTRYSELEQALRNSTSITKGMDNDSCCRGTDNDYDCDDEHDHEQEHEHAREASERARIFQTMAISLFVHRFRSSHRAEVCPHTRVRVDAAHLQHDLLAVAVRLQQRSQRHSQSLL